MKLLAVLGLAAASLHSPAPAAAQQAALGRGVDALRTGEYAEAVRLLEGAARSGPDTDRIEAARALARARAATGEYDAALAGLDAASSSLPAGALATARGRVLREVGRDPEALAAFDAAIAAGASDAVPARLYRAELLWERTGGG